MKGNAAKWFTLCLLCIIPFTVHAAKYGVLHLKPVGVSYATTETVASLLASDLTNYGHTVLNPDAMDDAAGEVLECYQSECAADAGAQAMVERVIYGSVSTLGASGRMLTIAPARMLRKLGMSIGSRYHASVMAAGRSPLQP